LLLLVAMFLTGLAAKERNDRFCVACHLHDEKFGRLIASSPADLAGFHHWRKGEVGCIACHGGADLGMRLRVWAVAEFDTAKFLVGAYREPTHMRLPLRDAECRQCHTRIPPAARATRGPVATTGVASPKPAVAEDPSNGSTFAAEAETEGRGGGSYHAIREHDSVRVLCVSCHASHTTDSDAAGRFVSKTRIVPICRGCHKEM
jgi:predicted CXXCH cytochrome family protein